LAGDDHEKLISVTRLKYRFASLSLARSPVRGNSRLLCRRKNWKGVVRNSAACGVVSSLLLIDLV
jgi:hypothetical protein